MPDATYLEQHVRVVVSGPWLVLDPSGLSTVYQLNGHDAGLKVPELPDSNIPGG